MVCLYIYPSPVNAQHDCICHWCFLIDVKSNWRDISAADIAPFKSCTQARTNGNGTTKKGNELHFIHKKSHANAIKFTLLTWHLLVYLRIREDMLSIDLRVVTMYKVLHV